LEISNQVDPDWWQAHKVFEDGGESLQGLIPARHVYNRSVGVNRREVLRESYVLSVAIEEKNKRKGKGGPSDIWGGARSNMISCLTITIVKGI
jgi:hypothetical protein